MVSYDISLERHADISELLAPYAMRDDISRGRRYVEVFKDNRPAFERDRDRIIHCTCIQETGI